MKIVRERPSEKRYHQVTAPLVVELPWGERKAAMRWSLGGLLLEGLEGPLPQEGEALVLKPELPFQGFEISFEVDAKVTKADPATGRLGVEFVELTERAHDLLVHEGECISPQNGHSCSRALALRNQTGSIAHPVSSRSEFQKESDDEPL